MTKLHQEDVRRKIQVSQLLNVLQNHALSGDGELAPTRLKAIEILLRKSMPDLTAIDLSGEVQHKHTLLETLKSARDAAESE